MEYKTITTDQIWTSAAATALIFFFEEQVFPPEEYDKEKFRQDFRLFFQDNRPMITSMGFDTEHIRSYNFERLCQAEYFRQVLTRFEHKNSHLLPKLFSDFILQRNIEEGRPIFNRRASRTATTASMFESNQVDKSELMFY